MSQTPIQQFKLGNSSFIDATLPENQQVLAQIQATPALTLADLLKIASFHKAYVTNEDLANRLAVLSMQRLTRDQQFQAILAKSGDTVIEGTTLNDIADRVEDFFNGSIDAEDADTPETFPSFSGDPQIHEEIRWIPVVTPLPDLGLLIKTITNQFAGNVPESFVIGICPEPASLPG